MGSERPYLAGAQEFAAIYNVQPLVVSQWIGRGVLNREHALIVSGSTYWLLHFVRNFGETGEYHRERDDAALIRVARQQPGCAWVATPDQAAPVAGLQELGALFGVGQHSMGRMMRTGRLPAPDWRLSGSPLWLLDTLVDHAPRLRERARSLAWEVDREVEAALRDGSYTGPGSVVKARGPAAHRA